MIGMFERPPEFGEHETGKLGGVGSESTSPVLGRGTGSIQSADPFICSLGS